MRITLVQPLEEFADQNTQDEEIRKNSTVEMITLEGLELGSFIPITKVSTMIPITSSMIAALIMVVPVSVLR